VVTQLLGKACFRQAVPLRLLRRRKTFLAALRSREPLHLARPRVVPPHRHALPVDDQTGQRAAAAVTRRHFGRRLPDEQVGAMTSQLGTAARQVGCRDPDSVRLEPRRPVVRTLVCGHHVDSKADPLRRSDFLT